MFAKFVQGNCTEVRGASSGVGGHESPPAAIIDQDGDAPTSARLSKAPNTVAFSDNMRGSEAPTFRICSTS